MVNLQHWKALIKKSSISCNPGFMTSWWFSSDKVILETRNWLLPSGPVSRAL